MTCCPDYIVGDAPRFTATFEVPATGVATDPTTVTASVQQPNGIETTFVYGVGADIRKDAVGVYSLAVAFDAPGSWVIRWKSGGTLVSARETKVAVQPSAFATP